MLSEKLRSLRRHSGLSQEELAERLGVSRQAVSKWELGSAVPTADKLVEISDFFGVSLDFLMREGEENPHIGEIPKRTGTRRIIAGCCLIGAAVCAFLFIGIIHALESQHKVGGSFSIHLDGVGAIAVSAVLCAAAGAALLISSKK